MWPAVGVSRLEMQPMVVVLPAPFGPSRPKISPGCAVNAHILDGDDIAVLLSKLFDFDHDFLPAPSRSRLGPITPGRRCFPSRDRKGVGAFLE